MIGETLEVAPEDAGARLDRWLARALAVPVARARALVEEGRVTIRGRRCSPVRKLFGIGSHPGGLKEAMVQLGMIQCGQCRRPALPLSSAQKQQVTGVLKEAGLL